MKFQYDILHLNRDNLLTALNEWGSAGWLLIDMKGYDDPGQMDIEVFLCRQVTE